MIQKLSRQIADYLLHNGIIDNEDDAEICAYGYEHILADVLQSILLIVMGLHFNILVPLVIYVLFFGSIKQYAGGWHASSHLQCFLATTGLSVLVVAITGACRVPWWLPIPVGVACLIITFLFAPVPVKGKPQTQAEIARLRRRARAVAVFQFLLLSLCAIGPLSGKDEI